MHACVRACVRACVHAWAPIYGPTRLEQIERIKLSRKDHFAMLAIVNEIRLKIVEYARPSNLLLLKVWLIERTACGS